MKSESDRSDIAEQPAANWRLPASPEAKDFEILTHNSLQSAP